MTVDVQHDVQSVAQAPAKGYMSDLKAFLRPGIGRSLLEFERLFQKTDRSKVATNSTQARESPIRSFGFGGPQEKYFRIPD